MKKIATTIIRVYKATWVVREPFVRMFAAPGAPESHVQCKFVPTCSQYMEQAIEKYGVVRGGLKGLWRIMRCHPWSTGGYDPVE